MGFEDEYTGRSMESRSTTIKAFLPVMGLFLLVAVGAISYVLSEPAHQAMIDNIDNIPADVEVQYLVGAVIFVVLLMFVGMVYAAFAPKPGKRVTEAEMKRERMMKEREKKMQKKRKQEINRQMAESRKQSEKRK